METENLLNHEQSRMTAFRLLSDCFFLPDPGLSEKLERLEINMANVCEPAFNQVQIMRKEFKAGADLEPRLNGKDQPIRHRHQSGIADGDRDVV